MEDALQENRMDAAQGRPLALVVMGPSGVGKTTVAKGIAEALSWRFAEADEFHPPANVAKMRAGTPLTDDVLWPWLRSMRDWIGARAAEGESVVCTCSALKRSYRDLLRQAEADVRFVYLTGDPALVAARIGARRGHYMPPSLLASQFADLEPPHSDEPGITVDVAAAPDAVVREALAKLGLDAPSPRDR